MTVRIGRHEIMLAKASEFEIVTLPGRPRILKCRRRPATWRPEMEWRETAGLKLEHDSERARRSRLDAQPAFSRQRGRLMHTSD
jgi:hypothetical protein